MDRIPTQISQTALLIQTPAYIYDLGILKETSLNLKNIFEQNNIKVLFASMANDLPLILSTLESSGIGACVNSLRHLAACKNAGIHNRNIHFTSSGIPTEDMVTIAKENVIINLDSISQLETWIRVNPGVQAGLRINVASLSPSDLWPKDRLGIHAYEVLDLAKTTKIIDQCINGLHVYLGTNFLDEKIMLERISVLFDFAEKIKSIKYINLGGGIGINYTKLDRNFNILNYALGIKEIALQFFKKTGRKIDLYIEPGRAMVSSCGFYITTVTDIKNLDGERFIAVDGSIASFPRPFNNPETPHEVITLIDNDTTPKNSAIVVGRTTFSKDILGKSDLPINIKAGDRLIFKDAGAYSFTMSSRFLGQIEPSQHFIPID